MTRVLYRPMSGLPHHSVGSKLLAEGLGTFCLVFAGTGAIVFDAASNGGHGGAITHVGVAMVFGLVVLAMILALGRVSGAHINPAVTIAFVMRREIGVRLAGAYVIVQIAGALAASALLRVLVGHDPTLLEASHLGATLPSGEAWVSLVLEGVLTFFLMLVILGSGSRGGPLLNVAIAVGATVGLEALFAGPICGASMNPARSIGPAVVSGHLEHLWMYVVAPVAGAIGAVGVWRVIEPASEAHA